MHGKLAYVLALDPLNRVMSCPIQHQIWYQKRRIDLAKSIQKGLYQTLAYIFPKLFSIDKITFGATLDHIARVRSISFLRKTAKKTLVLPLKSLVHILFPC